MQKNNWNILTKMYWYYASMLSVEDWNNITNDDLKFNREQLHIQGLIVDLKRSIKQFKHK